MDQELMRLKDFLDTSVSVYHAAAALERELIAAGNEKLREQDEWNLVPGGAYYLTRGGTAVLAFRIPEGAQIGRAHV